MKPSRGTPTARLAAVNILVAWESGGKSINAYLEQQLGEATLDPRDRQLCHHLVLGTLRRLRVLDTAIGCFASHPLDRMQALTRAALRIGAYQLLFMDRIPARAAVNETVQLLRTCRQPPWLTGFVNGVLRKIGAEKQSLLERLVTLDPCAAHPPWLIERWRQKFGQGVTDTICSCNDREPPLTLRCNNRLQTREALMELFRQQGISCRPGLYAPDSLIVEDWCGAVTSLPGLQQGAFQIQDEAAQLATLLAGPFPAGCTVLDACAGLGGKTSYLAALLPEDARLTAVEPEARRYRLLLENLQRLGRADRCHCHASTLAQFRQTVNEYFDTILLDAPCSGTGVIRRHPDIRWNRSPDDLGTYQAQQLDLLHEAALLLKPGGTLLYATCSLEPEENEAVIAAFRNRYPRFRIADCRPLLPAAAAGLVDGKGCFHPTPAQGLDGFFAARLIHDGL